jgi:hypothetical protein
MRQGIRSVLLTLVTLSALGVTGVASASAHEFVASKTGALSASVSGNVTFPFAGIEPGLEPQCKKAIPTGSVTALKSAALIVKVAYSECSYAAGSFPISPFSAEYEVRAEGKEKLLHNITIESPGPECRWTWVPTGTEESVVTYTNSTPVKTIKAVRNSKHMKVEIAGSESLCGHGKTVENGEWKETSTFGVEAGTLEWK